MSNLDRRLLLVSIREFRYHLEARLSAEQLRPPPQGWALDPRYRQTSEALQAVRGRRLRLSGSAPEEDVAAVNGVDTAAEALAAASASRSVPSTVSL